MATQTVAATSTQIKKPGPPVPPRPQHASITTNASANLFKIQKETYNRTTKTTAEKSTSIGAVTSSVTIEQPAVYKKTTTQIAAAISIDVGNVGNVAGSAASGRTVIYKSPIASLQKKQETASFDNKRAAATKIINGNTVAKPPLKLRKAPDVPITKPRSSLSAISNKSLDLNDANADNSLIKDQKSSNVFVVNLNRHHSMGSPKTTSNTPGAGLKDTRLSLGKVDFEKMGKIHLDQLQPGLPLPKPRKIVKMPVATLDLEEETVATSNNSTSLFRRSKTTLDNLTKSAANNITTISTSCTNNYTTSNSNTSNGFLSGKTVEIKNNLKNAAERLFSEIIVNQQKSSNSNMPPATVITKHERAIQHQALLEQEIAEQRQKRLQQQQISQMSPTAVRVIGNSPMKSATTNNCTRININTASNPLTPSKSLQIVRQANATEKKTAFHELLISELTAMRTKSSSMENLQNPSQTLEDSVPRKMSAASSDTNKIMSAKLSPRKRCNSLEDHEDADMEDIDADNVEDAEGYEHENSNLTNGKALKVTTHSGTPRKRSPSGCSSDSSPYGTERSARIRTSDWIEVGDNGKQVTLTSCHISLEDSGLEDEERLDDMSSGVGDSWDSVKEAENQKRCRNVKRVMSITDLPPLPKSLSGFNKMLGSDSGLLSDVDTNGETNNIVNNNTNSNTNNKIECQKDDNDSIKTTTTNNHINNENEPAEEIINETNGNDHETTNTTTKLTATATTTTTPATDIIPSATPTGCTLDTQLAILKKEMYGLRQLDLSLLSQLWALNDSIQEFRNMLQEQEQDQESCSPHSPTPSSYDSVSTDDDEENDDENDLHAAYKNSGAIPKIITTQPKLTKLNNLMNDLKDVTLNTLTTSNLKPPVMVHSQHNKQHQKPALPKPIDVKPVPRMRSAPPPPPTNRKGAAPPRPT